MRPLEGRRIGLLESRRADDLAMLVARLGGSPTCAPAVREVVSDADCSAFLERLLAGQFTMVIFLTGTGASALLEQARRRGVLPSTLDALRALTTACRGPKPLGVLTRFGIRPAVVTGKPHTTRELLQALAEVPLQRASAALVHYGERTFATGDALRERGARVEDVCLYEWAMPEDLGPLRALVADATLRRLDALLFTSQVQFRHVLAVAHANGSADRLVDALATDVVVGAIGPVCAEALREGGIIPDVLPAQHHSAALIKAVADYFDLLRPPP